MQELHQNVSLNVKLVNVESTLSLVSHLALRFIRIQYNMNIENVSVKANVPHL